MTRESMMDLKERAEMGIFDSESARKGYALNKMCYSFNQEPARTEFLADEMAYCRKFGLNEQQMAAIRSRKKTDFVMAGGSLYYYGKFVRLYPGANGAYAYTSKVGQKGEA
jgi:protocatechuate 4,5-dioxygenase alpha subunit